MEPGVYEQSDHAAASSSDLASESALEREIAAVDPGDQPHVLSRHVESVLHRVLASTSDLLHRLEVVNRILAVLSSERDAVAEPARQLNSAARDPQLPESSPTRMCGPRRR